MSNQEEKGLAVRASSIPEIAGSFFKAEDSMKDFDIQAMPIGIIHQAQMFSIEDAGGTRTVPSFRATIINVHRANAYWAESFDDTGGGVQPTCSSMDGITPRHDSEDVQAETCAKCPKNEWKSGGKRGKACKNMKRIHVLFEGGRIPYRLTLPPTNIKPVDEYMTKLLSMGEPFQLVETEFSLKKVQNKDNIVYSQLVLKRVGVTPFLNPDDIPGSLEKYKKHIERLHGVMQTGDISSSE